MKNSKINYKKEYEILLKKEKETKKNSESLQNEIIKLQEDLKLLKTKTNELYQSNQLLINANKSLKITAFYNSLSEKQIKMFEGFSLKLECLK